MQKPAEGEISDDDTDDVTPRQFGRYFESGLAKYFEDFKEAFLKDRLYPDFKKSSETECSEKPTESSESDDSGEPVELASTSEPTEPAVLTESAEPTATTVNHEL